MDHVGLLPDLIDRGFIGKVYSTKATKELTLIMLEDAMRISGKTDIQKILMSINFICFDEKQGFKFGDPDKNIISIAEDLTMYPIKTSHVLGSCGYTLNWMMNEVDEDDEASKK